MKKLSEKECKWGLFWGFRHCGYIQKTEETI